jgi:hypothetical protein
MSNELHDQINAELKAFQENPVAFMNQRPLKREVQTGEGGSTALDQYAYVEARDALRNSLDENEAAVRSRAAFAANDQANGFTDTFTSSGLRSMEDQGLMSARLEVSPWSDDYWALYLGVLGKRYADTGFPKSMDWKANFDYIQNHPAAAIAASGNQDAINRLSPAEKYDILVGDKNFLLTKQMWEEGRGYYERNGSVETWMGICHGWAPASYMLPRPVNAVTVLAADGKTKLTFYPSDIKGLASLLWAKASPRTRFIGGRCNDMDPTTDPQTGRILSDKCFDTNPGTWHLAVVNQIGVSKRSMVMDATYDYEVWNQPVLGYRYSYFNPATQAAVDSLVAATVAKASFTTDKFAKYRSQNTNSIVGIAMDVDYIVETSPSQSTPDSQSRDAVNTARYLYDLELDFSGKIIGGEWYQNAHPDFLWTPAKGSRALPSWESHSSLRPEDWLEGQSIPSMWQQVATITSEYGKAPMAAITERLIQLATR